MTCDQSDISKHCRDGTLTKKYIVSYTEKNDLDTPIGEKKLTPLAIACESGQLRTVGLLLDNGASANACSQAAQQRPPIFYAITRAPKNKVEIVQRLLTGGADVDQRFPEDHNATAIMIAITEVQDSEVVRALVAGKASLSSENASGISVRMLAKEYGMEQELGPAQGHHDAHNLASHDVVLAFRFKSPVEMRGGRENVTSLGDTARDTISVTSIIAEPKVGCSGSHNIHDRRTHTLPQDTLEVITAVVGTPKYTVC